MKLARLFSLVSLPYIIQGLSEKAHTASLYGGDCSTSVESSFELAEGFCYRYSDTSSLKIVCGKQADGGNRQGSVIQYSGNLECNEGDSTVAPETRSFTSGACMPNVIDGSKAASISCYAGDDVEVCDGCGAGDDGQPHDGDGGSGGGGASSNGASGREAKDAAVKAILGLSIGFAIVALLRR